MTVVAHNYFGASAVSAPLVGQPVTLPLPPRQVWWSPAGGRYTVHWSPPSDDGGSPVVRYRVDLLRGRDGSVAFRGTTSGLSLRLPRLPADHLYIVEVFARNAVGEGGAGETPAPLATDVGVLTGVDTEGHGRWRWSTSTRWHGLGGHLEAPPGVARAGGAMWFVGSTRAGTLLARTRATPWRVLSTRTCHEPYAGHDAGTGLTVYCRDAARHILVAYVMDSQLRTGHPTITPAEWEQVLPVRRVLGMSAADGEVTSVAARVAAFDAAGDNVVVESPLVLNGWRKARMACPRTPAVTTSGVQLTAVCATDHHHLAWVVADFGGSVTMHRWRTPAWIRLGVGAVDFGRAMDLVTAVDAAGRLRLVDLAQRRWWTLGRSTTSPVRISRWAS